MMEDEFSLSKYFEEESAFFFRGGGKRRGDNVAYNLVYQFHTFLSYYKYPWLRRHFLKFYAPQYFTT